MGGLDSDRWRPVQTMLLLRHHLAAAVGDRPVGSAVTWAGVESHVVTPADDEEVEGGSRLRLLVFVEEVEEK